MIIWSIVATLAILVAALIRAGSASLLRTPMAVVLRDASEDRPGAKESAGMLHEREVVVPAVNVVHALLMVLATVIGTWAIVRTWSGSMLGVALVAFGLGLVMIGDLLPRAVGRRRARTVGYRLAPLLSAAVRFGSWATEFVTEEEDHESDRGDEEDEGESELISSVLEFSETIVREVMVPRTDMTVVAGDDPFASLLRMFDDHGYSRLPVVGEGPDDVIGLVIIKDILPVLASAEPPERVSDVMRPIDFVPETKRIPELLRDMQASKSHMAVVVDEYGGTAGIVTIEDLLEELVGEIVDEYDDDELLVSVTEAGTWRVDGRLAVAELSELVESDLPDDEWDTVGGLVLGLAGRVPDEGEVLRVGDVGITVLRVQGRRIATVEVARVVDAKVAGEAR
jgi:CBS domain containing-hemolysin-like protein